MAESLQQTERQRREFIANISHELKTPMTTIAGYTDGILDGTIPPENEKQYLRIIANESRRLSRLVRRMLDVSQLQAIDPLRNGNHFDVCESMRRVLISMEKKINDRHLDVEADIPDEPILVEPKAMLSSCSRLMGLDGNAKMGKSLGNAIYLSDTAETVLAKVKTAVTDPSRISLKDPGHPEVCTVNKYHQIFNPTEHHNETCRKVKDAMHLKLYFSKSPTKAPIRVLFSHAFFQKEQSKRTAQKLSIFSI